MACKNNDFEQFSNIFELIYSNFELANVAQVYQIIPFLQFWTRYPVWTNKILLRVQKFKISTQAPTPQESGTAMSLLFSIVLGAPFLNGTRGPLKIIRHILANNAFSIMHFQQKL